MRTVSFMNAKGGVAKTTSALCLAQYLSSKGHSVLFIDLDPQANATKTLLQLAIEDSIEGHTLYDVVYDWVLKKKGEEDKLPTALREIGENLTLLPAHRNLEPLKDYAKSNTRNPLKLLSSILKPIQARYEFCVVDCPADLSIYVESTIHMSDLIIVPSQYDAYGFEGISIVFQAIKEIHDDDEIPHRVLYTMHNKQATKIKEDMGEYEVFLRDYELPFRVPVDQQVRNAQGKKHSLMTSKEYRTSKARAAYEQLGEYVLQELSNG